MSKTDVATTKSSAVGQAYDYGDMSHAGFEETKLDDLSIPFVNVMQTNSEIVEDEIIPNVKPGDFVNSVTMEIMKQPIGIIPVHKEEIWVEWRPRNQGGGILDRFSPDSEVVQKLIKENGGSRIPPKGSDNKRIAFKGPNGGEVIETYYVYCLILGEDETVDAYCVLSFSSTKIKVHKDWMTAMYMQKGRPPMFANRAKLSSVKQKNNDGTFFNFGIHPYKETWRESLINPVTERHLLEEAQNFRDMILNGLANPDYESIKGTEEGSSEESSKGSRGKTQKQPNDDEMPF